DAELPAQPADANAARRRHRMPLRKEFAASREDTQETTPTDEQPKPEAAEVPEVAPSGPRRRWRLFRRRPKKTEPEPVSTPAEDVAEAKGSPPRKRAPRVPTGKASRTAKPVIEPEPTGDETPVDESADAERTEPADAPAEDAPQEEQILVPHRPAGKRLTA